MSPYGSANVTDGAVDVDSPEFAARFGPQEDDGSEFDPPADFDDNQDMQDLRDAHSAASKARKAGKAAPKLTARQQAAEERRKAKEKEKAAAAKAAEREAKAAAKAAEQQRKAEERAAAKAAREAGPDTSFLYAAKPAARAMVQNIPVADLDGIDGGDPVEAEFVENVRKHGVLVPIMVRPVDDGRYNIIFGKRRSQAARAAGLETVPAVVERRKDSNDYVLALAENYARSNNVIEEHRMVMALLGHFNEQGIKGANDRKAIAAIVDATGMRKEDVKAARDIGRLLPLLFQAVEDGNMSPWSALQVSRMPEQWQQVLIDEYLAVKGAVTKDDVLAVRARQQAAERTEKVNDALAGGDDVEGELDEEKPASRTEQVAALVRHCQSALALAQGLSAPSPDEEDAVALLEQIIQNLTTSAG